MRFSFSPKPFALATSLAFVVVACNYDKAYRQDAVPPVPPVCKYGEKRCDRTELQVCEPGVDGRAGWALKEDCALRSLACASGDLGCQPCVPASTTCAGELGDRVDKCRADGSGYDPGPTCKGEGKACRRGVCDDLCGVARTQKSNIGCEYWAADLDNANVGASLNAAKQQFAVVVSNPQPDVAANVVIEQDDSLPGEKAAVRIVAKARVTPQNLEVFLLGPRSLDGLDDLKDTGETHTALTRHAFKITSDVPIIAYQFNPLENVSVFSNDASLLKPVEAIGGAARYVVVGWPQTIAADDSPDKGFPGGTQLRAFLTIVGTREATNITLKTKAAIVAGGPIEAVPIGGTLTYTLQPFEVLNLETGSFQADFTGSILDASGPVVVFSGSEASDAPHWNSIATRSCCADHLEEQLDPARTAGRRYIVSRSPNRAHAVNAAGATSIGAFDEPDFIRVIAVVDGLVHIKTTLPKPNDEFYLNGPGEFREIEIHQDFSLESDGAIHVTDVQASQEAAGIPRGLPGGDPSLLIIPPIEQFRNDYVFLTPDKYSFDFVTVLAPKGTKLLFDGAPFDADACQIAFVPAAKSPVTNTTLSSGFDVWRCQLSFPTVDPTKPDGKQLSPGRQNDGVHRLQADHAVGLIVYGFDAFVSYAYAAGTELETLTPR